MGSKFLLNPWLNLAQKPVCSAQRSKHSRVRASACAAQRNGRGNSRMCVLIEGGGDIRIKVFGGWGGDWRESTDLSCGSVSSLQTDYLISKVLVVHVQHGK